MPLPKLCAWLEVCTTPSRACGLSRTRGRWGDAQVDAEYEQLCRDIESLEVQVAEFDKVPDKKIRAEDLSEALRKLGRKCTKARAA